MGHCLPICSVLYKVEGGSGSRLRIKDTLSLFATPHNLLLGENIKEHKDIIRA